MTRKDHMV